MFALLYFSEGLPWGFTAIALAALLRREQASLAEIGAYAAAMFAPWSLKWAWAPVVDLVRIGKAPMRAWILLSQTLMVATLLAMLGTGAAGNLGLLTALGVLHNFFAATQDTAIDALAVRLLPPGERGSVSGLMYGSMNAGVGIGGSGALFIASQFGFPAAFVLMAAMMTAILLAVRAQLRPEAEAGLASAHQSLAEFAKELYAGFLRSGRAPVACLILHVLPFGAMALQTALATPMQVDLGLTEAQIGAISLANMAALAAGCFLGGWLSDRMGRRRAIGLFYVLSVVPGLWLAGHIAASGTIRLLPVAVFVMAAASYNFVFGLHQSALNALRLELTSPAIAGTQFTAYAALMNTVFAYSAYWQGSFAKTQGYPATLTLDASLALLPLVLLPLTLRRER